MQNLLITLKKEFFPISLILILALARLIPHPPNFTPIIAVAIMSGYFFKNINLSFLTLIVAMLVSDLFIGFYENVIFVYASLLLITFVFYRIAIKINFKNLFIYGFVGSLIFFIVSNFGVCETDTASTKFYTDYSSGNSKWLFFQKYQFIITNFTSCYADIRFIHWILWKCDFCLLIFITNHICFS